jgi:glycosyltransferase involved in cell wall biosynthesis
MAQTNVLHIIDTLGIGGAEKVMIGAVNSLPEFQHHVVYLNGSDAMACRLPVSCKIKRLNYLSKKFDVPRCALELNRYIRKHKIDIVHSHLFVSTIIARLACPKNVKLFTTIHSLPSRNYFVGKMAKWLERITYKKRHHLIAICNEVFNDYNQCIGMKGPYTILYNYVEDVYHAKEYRKANFENTLRLVAVGNLKPAKNYGYLVEAFKSMPKNVHLDIFGSGPLHRELQAEIEKHNLNIRLCGVREDINNVLRDYDAFIMSSIFEGQPISLLEAMACGMPAILSDIPVLREATNNQAIFYDLNNVSDLVKKVTAVANHEVDLDEFAKAGFDRVKKIASKENYMVMLKKVYLEHQDYRHQTYQIPPVKIFRPALPAAAS